MKVDSRVQGGGLRLEVGKRVQGVGHRVKVGSRNQGWKQQNSPDQLAGWLAD